MKQELTTLKWQGTIQGNYQLLELEGSQIAPQVKPGQFVNLLIPELKDAVLRRPFSVYKASAQTLSIIYKVVGKGTRAMRALQPGTKIDLIGPLGNGFPYPESNATPVLVGGGYGMAALYLLAQRSPNPGVAFFGGGSAKDLICLDEFEKLGWNLVPATEDGSLGERGLVTKPLKKWIQKEKNHATAEIFACGPTPMLKAVGELVSETEIKAWLSMDRHMCCGVGVCHTCVIKVRDGNSWRWARCCKEGPVFERRELVWD